MREGGLRRELGLRLRLLLLEGACVEREVVLPALLEKIGRWLGHDGALGG